jgi:hypothetical protein
MPSVTHAGFSWSTYVVDSLLPQGWRDELMAVAEHDAVFHMLEASSVTSREASPFEKIPSLTVDGRVLRDRAPWLFELYQGPFRDLAATTAGTAVACAREDLYGAVLNVQRGAGMRYECHVDSNPLQGLLYVTTHAPGEGGELVVARDPGAHSVADVDAACDLIYPVAGHLVFFDARQHPHYVRALADESAVRVVVAMNFYTEDSPESARPADLDGHLFGV